MKKNWRLILPLLLLLLAPLALHAQESSSSSKGMLGIQSNHSDLIRVRERGMSSSIQARPMTPMTLTCIQDQLELSAGLGRWFSDIKISFQLPSLDVFCLAVKYSLGGISFDLSSLLGLKLKIPNICTPPLSWAKAFAPNLTYTKTLPSVLGCTVKLDFGAGLLAAFDISVGSICASDIIPQLSCSAIQDHWNNAMKDTKLPAASGNIDFGGGDAGLNLPNMGIGGGFGASSNNAGSRSSGGTYSSYDTGGAATGGGSLFGKGGGGGDFGATIGGNGAEAGIITRSVKDKETLAEPGRIDSWPTTPTFAYNSDVKGVIDWMYYKPSTRENGRRTSGGGYEAGGSSFEKQTEKNGGVSKNPPMETPKPASAR